MLTREQYLFEEVLKLLKTTDIVKRATHVEYGENFIKLTYKDKYYEIIVNETKR